jgi:hypothetical protein
MEHEKIALLEEDLVLLQNKINEVMTLTDNKICELMCRTTALESQLVSATLSIQKHVMVPLENTIHLKFGVAIEALAATANCKREKLVEEDDATAMDLKRKWEEIEMLVNPTEEQKKATRDLKRELDEFTAKIQCIASRRQFNPEIKCVYDNLRKKLLETDLNLSQHPFL